MFTAVISLARFIYSNEWAPTTHFKYTSLPIGVMSGLGSADVSQTVWGLKYQHHLYVEHQTLLMAH